MRGGTDNIFTLNIGMDCNFLDNQMNLFFLVTFLTQCFQSPILLEKPLFFKVRLTGKS